MKAVILAAGEGKRMLPLTRTAPKPLLRVGNQTIIDHIFDAFPPEIDSVIIVVGYLKKKIQQQLGARFQGRPIRYMAQSVLNGSATALFTTEDLFLPSERFLLIYGDELPTKADVARCMAYEFSWFCYPSPDPRQSGIATVSPDGRITEVIEKPEHPVSDLAAAGLMIMNSDIFKYKLVQHVNGEYYLTSLMNQFLKDHPVQAVVGKPRPGFISPDDLQKITLDQYGALAYE